MFARILDQVFERLKSVEQRAKERSLKVVFVNSEPNGPRDPKILYIVKGSKLDPFKDLYKVQGEVGRYRDFFWAFATLTNLDFFTPEKVFSPPTSASPQFKDMFPWGQWMTQLLFSDLGLGLAYVVMRIKYPQFSTPQGRTILLGLITASLSAVLAWNAAQATGYNRYIYDGYSPRAAGYLSSLNVMVEGPIQYTINSVYYNSVRPGESIFDIGERCEQGDLGQVFINNNIDIGTGAPNAAVWQLTAQGYVDLNELAIQKYPQLDHPAFRIIGAIAASGVLAKAVEYTGVGGAILATKMQEGLRRRHGFFHQKEMNIQPQVGEMAEQKVQAVPEQKELEDGQVEMVIRPGSPRRLAIKVD